MATEIYNDTLEAMESEIAKATDHLKISSGYENDFEAWLGTAEENDVFILWSSMTADNFTDENFSPRESLSVMIGTKDLSKVYEFISKLSDINFTIQFANVNLPKIVAVEDAYLEPLEKKVFRIDVNVI